jgi:hypothetical protein
MLEGRQRNLQIALTLVIVAPIPPDATESLVKLYRMLPAHNFAQVTHLHSPV